jgi:hypothetical protein
MDRTVPKTGSEEIELYMRTYYSLLRSTHTIPLETLVEAHLAMESSLHVKARSPEPDVSALVYSSLRLPRVMPEVEYVLLGQVEKSFVDAHYDVMSWERVHAVGRRRRMHFDGKHTLAAFIVSRSDIDDLIPMLTAYQIEWNKLHWLLKGEVPRLFLAQNAGRTTPLTDAESEMLAGALKLDAESLRRLEVVWGDRFIPTLTHMAQRRKQIGLRLIAGSQADYRRATAYWWETVRQHTLQGGATPEEVLDLEDRPVYFVSSNTHSLINLMTGFALREERDIIAYIEAKGHEDLLAEYRAILSSEQAEHSINARPNMLYYALKKYLSDLGSPAAHAARERVRADQRAIGIHRIPSKHGIDIETQVMELSRLRPDWLDPRVSQGLDLDLLRESDAVIINIDYPLGLGAYEIMARTAERVTRLLGVYVMGKAATLNGRIGDVMLPNVVHDEHSQNTYLFNNCFSAQDVAPYMNVGMVLDNQKAISAPGTFLQNRTYMSVFYHEGYTIIEMEAGPYLSAIYEAVRPKRHPQNEIVTLHGAPFEIGFLHYASDTPFTRGHNLGAGSLSYAGVESTYATAIAILRRVLLREIERLRARSNGRTPATAPPPIVQADPLLDLSGDIR